MELFFLNLGLSNTMSKAMPYILMLILGILLAYYTWKKIKSILGKIIAIILFATPFTIYFILHPIYQGDFTNEARELNHTEETSELSGKKLVVVAMPGCPFCELSFEQLSAFQDRYKNVKIEYLVTSRDTTTLDFYKAVNKERFPLALAKNPEALANIVAEGRFPTYVLIDGDKPMHIWNNNNFGVVALDEVVKTLN